MVRAPASKTQVLRRAAVLEFFQNRLTFRTEKKVREQKRRVRMGWLSRDRSAADIGRHDIHRHPRHRRAFCDGV